LLTCRFFGLLLPLKCKVLEYIITSSVELTAHAVGVSSVAFLEPVHFNLLVETALFLVPNRAVTVRATTLHFCSNIINAYLTLETCICMFEVCIVPFFVHFVLGLSA
jgi:hypothetical protein